MAHAREEVALGRVGALRIAPRLLQGLRLGLAIGDVLTGTQQSRHLTIGVLKQAQVPVKQPPALVTGLHGVVDLARGRQLTCRRRLEPVAHQGAIRLRHPLTDPVGTRPAVAVVRAVKAQQAAATPVQQRDATLQIQRQQGGLDGLDGGVQLLFGGAQMGGALLDAAGHGVDGAGQARDLVAPPHRDGMEAAGVVGIEVLHGLV